MCLILVAWRHHERHPLVIAANRDEYHARPAAPAAFWQDAPQVLAGRDLQAQGTWLGIARSGRFAAVTNYRGGHDPGAAESRGALVARFLAGTVPAATFVGDTRPSSYSGFNLLVCDGKELWWLSNRDGSPRRLAPGLHALGNLLLDSEDVQPVKRQFAAAPVALEPLFGVLATARIVAPAYGTRCATIVLAGVGGRVQFAERLFDAAGVPGVTSRYEFPTGPAGAASTGA